MDYTYKKQHRNLLQRWPQGAKTDAQEFLVLNYIKQMISDLILCELSADAPLCISYRPILSPG